MKHLIRLLFVFSLVALAPLAAVTALDITEAEARVARAAQAHNDALQAYVNVLEHAPLEGNEASRQTGERERALQRDLDQAARDLGRMRNEIDEQNKAALRAQAEKGKAQAKADTLKAANEAQLKGNEEQAAKRWADLRAWQKKMAAAGTHSVADVQQAVNHLGDALNEAIAASFADPARNAEAYDIPKELMPIARSLLDEPPIHQLLFGRYGPANDACNACGERLKQAALRGEQITAEHNALAARYNAGGGNDASLRAQIEEKKTENDRQLALCASIAQEYHQLKDARLAARKNLDRAMAASYLAHAKEWLAEWFTGGGSDDFTPPDGLPAPNSYFPLVGYPAKGIPYWTFPNGQRTPNLSKVINALAPPETSASDMVATDRGGAADGKGSSATVQNTGVQTATPDSPTPATKPARPAPKLLVGDSAPPLSGLTWLNSEPVTTFDNDKVYLVSCWAEWAPPSLLVIQHLNELADSFRGRPVVIIDVNVDDTAPASIAHSVQAMRFRAVADHADKRFNHTWITPYDAIPYSFLISNGKIVWTGQPSDIAARQITDLLALAIPLGNANQLYVAAVKSAVQARRSADAGDTYAAMRDYVNAARDLATLADRYTDSPLALDLVQGKATLQDLSVTKLFDDVLPTLGVSLAASDPFILSDLTANRTYVLPELQDRATLAITLAKAGRLDEARRLCERLPVVELRDPATRHYINSNNHLRAETAIAILRALPAGDPRLVDLTPWTIATVGLPTALSGNESVPPEGQDLMDTLIAHGQFEPAKMLPLPPKQYPCAIFSFIDSRIGTLALADAQICLQAHAADLDRASLAKLWWGLGIAWSRTAGGHDHAEACYCQALAISSSSTFKDIAAYLDLWKPGLASEDTLKLTAKSSPDIPALLFDAQDWPACLAYILSTETDGIDRTVKLIQLMEKLRPDPALASTYRQVAGFISRFPPGNLGQRYVYVGFGDTKRSRINPGGPVQSLIDLGEFRLADLLLRQHLDSWPRDVDLLFAQIYAVAYSTELAEDETVKTYYEDLSGRYCAGLLGDLTENVRLPAMRGAELKELDSLNPKLRASVLKGLLASKNEALLLGLRAKVPADSEEHQQISAALEAIRVAKRTLDQRWAEASSALSPAAVAKARADLLSAAFVSHDVSAFTRAVALINDAEAAFSAKPAPDKEDSATLEQAETFAIALLAANHRAKDAWQALQTFDWVKESLVIACAASQPDDAHALHRLHAAQLNATTAPKARALLQGRLVRELTALADHDDHTFAANLPAYLRESNFTPEQRHAVYTHLLSHQYDLMQTAPAAALIYARGGVATLAADGETADPEYDYAGWCRLIVTLAPDADALPLLSRLPQLESPGSSPSLLDQLARTPLLIELAEDALAAQHPDLTAAALAAAGTPPDTKLIRRIQILGIRLQLSNGHPDDAVAATLALTDPQTRILALSQLGVHAATHPHPWSETSAAKLAALAHDLIGHPDVMHPDSLPQPFPIGM